MKAGIVISRYRRSGGLERVAVEWARGLRRRGHDVVVYCGHADERDEGIEYVRVAAPDSPNWLRAYAFPRAAARAVRERPCDVLCSFGAAVFAQSVMGTAGPHAAWFEQGLRESPATTKEGLRRRLNPHHRVVLANERRIARRGLYERVYATSRRAADDWIRLHGIPRERAGVLENGVNLDEFRFDASARDALRAAWGATDRVVVLTIANEVARKGVDTLVRAFGAIKAAVPGAMLVAGGPAAERGGEIERLVRDARIAPDDVRLIGRVAEPAAAYAAADVFAFPTRYDPWGLVAIESLATGTPVVCSSVAGVAPQIRDGSTGVLLDAPRDSAAVADAVVRALAQPLDRDANRASVEHLSWDRIVERVEAILLEVLASRSQAVSA